MVSRCRLLSLAGLALLLTSMVACEKVPLLAPTGSTITLTVPTTVVAANQGVDVIAQVLEASGTPPHSGTSITFTSSLGTVSPATALTDANGRVIVRFQAGAASGIATITAISGGASTGVNSLKLSIGTAAVRAVRVNATPASVSALGGSTTIVANVLDVNGNGLPAASVIFSTSAGSLSSSVVITDGAGVATTVLTTAQQAVVTAAVGAQAGSSTGTTGATGSTGSTGTTTTTSSGQASGSVTVTVNTAPTLVITPPSTSPSAGIPASFTFAVTAASTGGTAVRNLRVTWGDGNAQDLGAVTGNAVVSHTYGSTGSYTITATLTDAAGNVQTVSTAVNVIPVASPTIIITPSVPSSCTSAGSSCQVSFVVQITPPVGVGIIGATIDFGDGSTQGLGGLTGSASVPHTYTAHGTFTVRVTVGDTIGRTTEGFTTVVVP